jgi:hypothetical protein
LEVGVFDFVDCVASSGAERRTVAINLMESIVPPSFGAREHAVEPLEAVELALQGHRRHFVNSQPSFVEHSRDFFLSVLIPRHPLLGALTYQGKYWTVTKSLQYLFNAGIH